VSKPQYRHAHQLERKRWEPVVAAGEAYCCERVCVMRSRWIAPGTRWDLAHDETGTAYLGPAHARCNRREGAARGNRMRTARRAPAQRPPQSGRWAL
jgi:hypothetical protein